LPPSKLKQTINEFEKVEKFFDTDKGDNFNKKQQRSIRAALKALKSADKSNLPKEFIKKSSIILLTHSLCWILLIFVYPKSPQIQAIFFWTPWMRRFFGLGYVGVALTWIPFLRSKLLAPFKVSLESDADLESFDFEKAYFADLQVCPKGTEEVQSIQKAIPKLEDPIVLEGESGLGKSMFLRRLVQSSKRIIVYLPAAKCDRGVIEAIQEKLHGPAKDLAFLRSLIYSDAIDICIDGLNEVTPDTRAKITNFVEHYSRGNVIISTQPLEWTPPRFVKTYILQPFNREQIEKFLVSRQAILPQNPSISGSNYEQACQEYLSAVLGHEALKEEQEHIKEQQNAVLRMLSNPMDLTTVAQMIAREEKPDLRNLQQQQYDLMAKEYQRNNGNAFPLQEFAEEIYKMRLKDKFIIPTEGWSKELKCMELYKMVISRKFSSKENQAEWRFRHEKIQEFFIVQTFLGKNNTRPNEHIRDQRFRGVYLLLATLMPLDYAKRLFKKLMHEATNSNDYTVASEFFLLLESIEQV
ncbi:MAG: PBS lyase, partial [Symploca sp. SIO1B1]|nr:PBS lyase [Symploca sp. SIO1B1]